ncbi:MAG: IS3 family transposase, partial [Cytophagaceae bacterium]
MQAVHEVKEQVGIKRACDSLGVSRMTEFRMRRITSAVVQKSQTEVSMHPRALSAVEQQVVLSVLASENFVDCAPASVYASLLEKGTYYCSQSTMYRLLRKYKATSERRRIRRHVAYEAPQLLAQAPNQVWTWDITKLHGHRKFEYYYLYVMLDIYSR